MTYPNNSSLVKNLYSVESPGHDLLSKDGETFYFSTMADAVAWMEENEVHDFKVWYQHRFSGPPEVVLAAGKCL